MSEPDFTDPAAPFYSYWAATHQVWNDWYRYDQVDPYHVDGAEVIDLATRRDLSGRRADHRDGDLLSPEDTLMAVVARREMTKDKAAERSRKRQAKKKRKLRAAQREISTALTEISTGRIAPIYPIVFDEVAERIETPSQAVAWYERGQRFLLDSYLTEVFDCIRVPYCRVP